jgi:hypothetical protein
MALRAAIPSFLTRLEGTLGLSRRFNVSFGADQLHALVFRGYSSPRRFWWNFGYREGPHDANGGPRSKRLFVNFRHVRISNHCLLN